MESLKGDVSFKVNFIDSGDNKGNYSVGSWRLIGVYDVDWSLGDDGTVNASMAFARREGDIRSHGNLIERLYGLGERSARVSLSKCLDAVDLVEADGRLIADPVSYGGLSALYRKIGVRLIAPDSMGEQERVSAIRIALSVGVVALRCAGLPLEELKESPAKHFCPDEVDRLISCFHGNVDFGNEWQEYKKMAREL